MFGGVDVCCRWKRASIVRLWFTETELLVPVVKVVTVVWDLAHPAVNLFHVVSPSTSVVHSVTCRRRRVPMVTLLHWLLMAVCTVGVMVGRSFSIYFVSFHFVNVIVTRMLSSRKNRLQQFSKVQPRGCWEAGRKLFCTCHVLHRLQPRNCLIGSFVQIVNHLQFC